MILLRKENDLLNSLIGKSFNQKNKFEANKILTEIHSKAERRSVNKNVLCYVVDNEEIQGVGGSTMMQDKDGKIVSNLILDNFGEIMNALHAGNPAPIGLAVNVKDTGGSARQLRFYLNNNWQDTAFGGADGINTQIGSGITPPARTDFKIETAFVTVPESQGITMTNLPVWNSALGQITTTGSVVAGGSGTVNEAVLTSLLQTLATIQKRFAYYRDIISPGVAFVPTQNIVLDYLVQL